MSYEKWNPKEPVRRMIFVASLLNLHKDDKVLDIGAYQGDLIQYLDNGEPYTKKRPIMCPFDFDNYFPLDVYDLKPKFYNSVQQNLNENQKLPFKDNSFECVVFVGTIEHLFYPEEILKEIKRVLKSKGIAIISFPNDANWYMRLLRLAWGLDIPFNELKYMHHWFFGEKGTRALLKKYFHVKEVCFYNGLYGRFIPGAKSEIFYKVKK